MLKNSEIVTDIIPKDASIFYEDGVPYLKYVGTAMMDNGVVVEVELPKMDLKFKNITTKREVLWNDGERLGSRYLINATQNIYVDHNDVWVNIRPVKRRVSLEQLEKELGYQTQILY